MKTIQPFHLAIPVSDIQEARKFYGEIFGCEEGRSSESWVDFDFFGHQLVIHYKPLDEARGMATTATRLMVMMSRCRISVLCSIGEIGKAWSEG